MALQRYRGIGSSLYGSEPSYRSGVSRFTQCLPKGRVYGDKRQFLRHNIVITNGYKYPVFPMVIFLRLLHLLMGCRRKLQRFLFVLWVAQRPLDGVTSPPSLYRFFNRLFG